VFDPLHYLVLLEQRPGAFEYAKPGRAMAAELASLLPSLVASVA